MGYYYSAVFVSKELDPILEWDKIGDFWIAKEDVRASIDEDSRDHQLRQWLKNNPAVASVWIGENNEEELFQEADGIHIGVRIQFTLNGDNIN